MPIKFGGLTLYDLDETSKGLEVSKITLRKYIKEGRLGAQKVGGRWLISEEALREFFKQKSEKKPKK